MSKENVINKDNGFKRFCHRSLDALNKHASRKKKHARGNQIPFFGKELLKAIMTRIKSPNIYQQIRSEENRIYYTKQIKFRASLLRKTKKRYYENITKTSVVDKKLFWKTVKSLLSDKVPGKDKVHLVEDVKCENMNL